MQISSSQSGAVRVLRIQGRLDHSQAKDFEAALLPQLDDCSPTGHPCVLDFSDVSYISSVGLRVLLLAAKKVSAQQGRVAIAGLSSIVAEVFEVSHFNRVIQVHPDIPAAAAALAS